MANDVVRAARAPRVAMLGSSPGAAASAATTSRPNCAVTGTTIRAWRHLTGSAARSTTSRPGPALQPPAPTAYPFDYAVADVLNSPSRARAFVRDYFDHEAPFFAMTRDAQTGLSFDGIDLDPLTRAPRGERRWTAASKECLDVALLAKIVAGDPLVSRLLPRDEAIAILTRKIGTYERFASAYPGYAGFLPWVSVSADGVVTPSDAYWQTHVPALDNAEWAFVLLGAEKTLRDAGLTSLADQYRAYNDRLATSMRRVFFDEQAGAVRDQALIANNRDRNTSYTSFPNGYLRHEHGVHEGAMALHFMTLYARPRLSDSQISAIWAQTEMQKVETPYGTTWQGFWGSSHEEWEFAVMPKRDLPEWASLFRIRQEIRTNDAVARRKPGFAASINSPEAPSAPYALDHGMPSIARVPVTDHPFYAIYGAFPVLLEQTKPGSGREGVAWLLNTLRAPNAVTSIGGGESVRNDGKASAPMKTIDGTFLNLLALSGGFEDIMRDRLRADGTYDAYQRALDGEYRETFQQLREPAPMAAPQFAVPYRPPA